METFFEKIGEERLSQLLDSFYDKVFDNDLIRPLFLSTPKDEIKHKQKLFLTQLLGGPNLYSQQIGPPQMRQRHFPHKITIEAKDEWLKCMKDSISELEWDENLKENLYNIFPRIAQHMVNS